MDTSTHIAMGIGLAGLSHLDPVISAQTEMAQAVFIGTIIGSNAPDFDLIFRLKSNATYFRRHRGISHSLPALFLWALVITGLIWLLWQSNVAFTHLLMWTFLAVLLHIFVDLFNVHGTQALYPFTRKWISFNCIHIFDPFIMSTHLIGIVLWAVGWNPGYVFLFIYILLAFYYVWRWNRAGKTLHFLKKQMEMGRTYMLIPTLSWFRWGFIMETDDLYYVGSIHKRNVQVLDTFRKDFEEKEIVEASKKDRNVQDFLHSTRHVHAAVNSTSFGFEVRWFDLRFRSKSKYPYMTVVYLDHQLNIIDSYMGWIFEEKKLDKKLSPQKVI